MRGRRITVRLPDDQVDFDQQVADGRVASRADGVARALRREHRRVRAERDLETLKAAGEDAELAGLATWASRQAFPVDP